MWWGAYGWRASEGGGAEDAPMLETDDIVAWNFYQRTAKAFVRDFGLMDGRIADMPYDGVAKSIFIEKLSAVHDAMMERDMKAAKEDTGEKPALVIEGAENG